MKEENTMKIDCIEYLLDDLEDEDAGTVTERIVWKNNDK